MRWARPLRWDWNQLWYSLWCRTMSRLNFIGDRTIGWRREIDWCVRIRFIVLAVYDERHFLGRRYHQSQLSIWFCIGGHFFFDNERCIGHIRCILVQLVNGWHRRRCQIAYKWRKRAKERHVQTEALIFLVRWSEVTIFVALGQQSRCGSLHTGHRRQRWMRTLDATVHLGHFEKKKTRATMVWFVIAIRRRRQNWGYTGTVLTCADLLFIYYWWAY